MGGRRGIHRLLGFEAMSLGIVIIIIACSIQS